MVNLLTRRSAGRPQEIRVDYAEGQPCVPVTINKAVGDSGAGMSLITPGEKVSQIY